MEASINWFIGIAALSVVTCAVGVQLGQSTDWARRLGLFVGVVLLVIWTWLRYHPAVAVHVIPVGVLSRIEGTAGVPLFMLVVGITWSRGRQAREKRTVVWAGILGAVYFLQGGLWMLQATPQVGFADTASGGAVRQSQEYSCVPAACATALNLLGIHTSEAEMARLTHTRPGTGATILRAMDGLRQRLEGKPYRVVLLQPSIDELQAIPLPALTPLRFERTRHHMVTLIRTEKHGVVVADPVEGSIYFSWKNFSQYYTEQLLVIVQQRS